MTAHSSSKAAQRCEREARQLLAQGRLDEAVCLLARACEMDCGNKALAEELARAQDLARAGRARGEAEHNPVAEAESSEVPSPGEPLPPLLSLHALRFVRSVSLACMGQLRRVGAAGRAAARQQFHASPRLFSARFDLCNWAVLALCVASLALAAGSYAWALVWAPRLRPALAWAALVHLGVFLAARRWEGFLNPTVRQWTHFFAHLPLTSWGAGGGGASLPVLLSMLIFKRKLRVFWRHCVALPVVAVFCRFLWRALAWAFFWTVWSPRAAVHGPSALVALLLWACTSPRDEDPARTALGALALAAAGVRACGGGWASALSLSLAGLQAVLLGLHGDFRAWALRRASSVLTSAAGLSLPFAVAAGARQWAHGGLFLRTGVGALLLLATLSPRLRWLAARLARRCARAAGRALARAGLESEAGDSAPASSPSPPPPTAKVKARERRRLEKSQQTGAPRPSVLRAAARASARAAARTSARLARLALSSVRAFVEPEAVPVRVARPRPASEAAPPQGLEFLEDPSCILPHLECPPELAGAPGVVGEVLRARDHFGVLGVAPGADAEAVRRARRARSLATHPDKLRGVSGAEEAARRVNAAAEVLMDEAGRGEYERASAEARRELRAALARAAGFGDARDWFEALEESRSEGVIWAACGACGESHALRPREGRSAGAARRCDPCGVLHAARDGEVWMERQRRLWGGDRITAWCVLRGQVWDMSENAACEGLFDTEFLRTFQFNAHDNPLARINVAPSTKGGGRKGQPGAAAAAQPRGKRR